MKEERKDKRNVPNLRFPGFEGSEERSYRKHLFKHIFVFTTGKNIKQNEASPEFETPCVRYGELYHMYNEVINEVINRTNLDKSELLFSKGDEILLPSAGEDPLDIGAASALTIENVAIGRTINILRPLKDRIYSQIYVAYFINHKLRKKIATLAKGVSISNVYNSDLKALEIILPNLKEQEKIASFLTLIDARIQTQNEIIQRLESLMNGLQYQIFNHKLRFTDWEDVSFPKWSKNILKKFLSIPFKQSPKEIEITKILTVKLHLKGVLLNERTDGLKIGATKYIIRRKGQFIYGKQNLFNGAFGIIPDEFDGFLSSGDVPSLEIDTKLINPMFLYYYLARPTYYKKLESIASGSGSKRIHETTLLSHIISVPILEEQNRIVSFLSKIENKIQVDKQVLEHLTNQKKYLLQQLFI